MKATLRARWTLAAATVAASLGLIAAQVTIGAATAVATPSTPVAHTEGQPAAGQFGPAAVQVLDKIVAGDYNGARANFDAVMNEQLPAERLGQAWGAYQQLFGGFRSHGTPEVLSRGQLSVVNVPLQMAKGPGQFRLTFDGDGRIAGLFFLRPGVPVPGA
jgi:hypothetical protein